jgi:SAM-dependent methyltransferase
MIEQVLLIRRNQCPWCGSSNGSLLREVSYQDAELHAFLKAFYQAQGCYEDELLYNAFFVLMACQKCSLVYQRDIPNLELMNRLYRVWIDPVKSFDLYDRRKSLGYYETLFGGIREICRFLGKDPVDTRVLDYSMGWGHWARLAAGMGLDVFGTEFTEEKRTYARRFGIGVLDEDGLRQRSFDLVNLEQVLEHVPDPADTLEKLCSVVRPGGLICIGVPYGDDIIRRLVRLDWAADKHSPCSLMPVQPLEHINCFNRGTLLERLHSLGFKEIRLPVQSRAERIMRECRRSAGRIGRKLLRLQRPPLTINLLAQRVKGVATAKE